MNYNRSKDGLDTVDYLWIKNLESWKDTTQEYKTKGGKIYLQHISTKGPIQNTKATPTDQIS